MYCTRKCRFVDDWFYGVMVSTLDFESSDPSSNLGRTWTFHFYFKLLPDTADVANAGSTRPYQGPNAIK